MAGSDDVATIPLGLEGPYGASARLPDFARFDKILLIAGGVGATFVMPIYRSILESDDFSHRLRFIWATRKLAETQWAFPIANDDDERAMEPSPHAVEVFVTQPMGPDLRASEAGEDVELAEDDQLLSMEEQMEKPRKGMLLRAGRPRISSIVDEEFSKASRVAVIACGPKALTETVSDCVEPWISRGIDVYWHDETFGW
jgi:ferredoxin-NADP reductase